MYKPVYVTISMGNECMDVAIQFVHQFILDLMKGEKPGTKLTVSFEAKADLNNFINKMNNNDTWTLIRENSKDISKAYSYHVKDEPSTMVKAEIIDDFTLEFIRKNPISVIASMDNNCVIANELTNDKYGLRKFKFYLNKADKIIKGYRENNSSKLSILQESSI